jgi:hypothetical protein
MSIEYELLQEAECVEFLENTHIMYLNLGGEQGPSVVFYPTGINISGALGKINLYFRGHIEEGIFLLLIEDDNEKFHWEIRKNRMEKENIIIFNKETFEIVLNDWLDKWTDISKGYNDVCKRKIG